VPKLERSLRFIAEDDMPATKAPKESEVAETKPRPETVDQIEKDEAKEAMQLTLASQVHIDAQLDFSKPLKLAEVISVYPGAVYTFQLRIAEANQMLEKVRGAPETYDMLRQEIMNAEEKKRTRVPVSIRFVQNAAMIPEIFIPEMEKRNGWKTQYILVRDMSEWFNSGDPTKQRVVRQILDDLKRRAKNLKMDNADNVDLTLLSKLGKAGEQASQQLTEMYKLLQGQNMTDEEILRWMKGKAEELGKKPEAKK
jgi:hypothetical protein